MTFSNNVPDLSHRVLVQHLLSRGGVSEQKDSFFVQQSMLLGKHDLFVSVTAAFHRPSVL